ncbi:type VII secretion integral membrane protein EccD [Streptomyces sp. NPDC048290]|uniref:type VII secretion integral membrane protein EccD n=1 Tax=Streptomyces sp. NPDC048290 TaxID=3155811 RepID=UPI003425FFA8
MSGNTVAGLCRLRFRSEDTAFDLAVPADVPLADLMPSVIAYAGAELAEQGVEHGGWILQRVGGEPLQEQAGCTELGLADGDELFLRPRREAIPPVHFDDIVDGVAAGMNDRPNSWEPRSTYRFAVVMATLVCGMALTVVALPGPHLIRAVAAAVVGVLLLLGAASASRAMGDAVAATALATAAVAALATAGALLPSGGGGDDFYAPRMLAGGAGAAGGTVLALAAVAASGPLFVAIGLGTALVMFAAAFPFAGFPLSHGIAWTVIVTVLFGSFIPAISFRFSGMKLPAMPRDAEELQQEIDPFPARDVLTRTVVADEYLTAFYTVVGLLAAAFGTVLALDDAWAAQWMVIALGVLLLLHGRMIGSTWQRLVVQLAGVWLLFLLTAREALAASPGERLLMVAGLLLLAAILAVVAWTIPGRRLIPHWGRAADLLHTFSAIALLPLVMQYSGLYRWARTVLS